MTGAPFVPDWFNLLGRSPLSSTLTSLLETLAEAAGGPTTLLPEVKSYRDCVYLNYFDLGLSLQFMPKDGYKLAQGLQMEALDLGRLSLENIDLFNVPASDPANARAKSKASHYKSYPRLPLKLHFGSKDQNQPVQAIRKRAADEEALMPLGQSSDNLPQTIRPTSDEVNGADAAQAASEGEAMSISLALDAGTTGQQVLEQLGEPDRKGGGTGPSAGSIGIWCEWSRLGVMVEFGGDEARGPQAWDKGKLAIWSNLTLFRGR
ncbi:hypothetical protein BKA62DRAFT_693510 [Auriculariales sp. MPI-PUGE-AT-0066]|nr:hypothetical protein BKA62DRAFT_693510 [Auriculariales sp. MPI-PUGE-AT-0066]